MIRHLFKSGANAILSSRRRNFPTIYQRNFGVTDTIMNFANNTIGQGKEKQFQEMLNNMTNTEIWTLRSWKNSIEKQLNSWMMYIPGMSSAADVQKVKSFKELLDSLTEAELDDYQLVNGLSRERIAKQTSKSVDDVNQLLFFYKQTRILSTWLKLKKANNEPLPQNEMELKDMQMEDMRLRTISAGIMAPKKKTGRGKRIPF